MFVWFNGLSIYCVPLTIDTIKEMMTGEEQGHFRDLLAGFARSGAGRSGRGRSGRGRGLPARKRAAADPVSNADGKRIR